MYGIIETYETTDGACLEVSLYIVGESLKADLIFHSRNKLSRPRLTKTCQIRRTSMIVEQEFRKNKTCDGYVPWRRGN